MRSKNIIKAIGTLMFIGFGLVCFLQSDAPRTVSARTGGADTYGQQCATCHGNDGKANTPRGRRKNATDLTKSKISTAQGIRVITNGREEMPSFKGKLSDAEIREVMAYIRGFRK